MSLRPGAALSSPALLALSSPSEGRSPKDQSTFQKLLHINASAQLEHPEYTGPHLPASALVPRLSALDGKVTPLQKELQDTLKGLLGDSSRGSFMVPTQYGWVLGEALPTLPLLAATGLLLVRPLCCEEGLAPPETIPNMCTHTPP